MSTRRPTGSRSSYRPTPSGQPTHTLEPRTTDGLLDGARDHEVGVIEVGVTVTATYTIAPTGAEP
ncbi:hypothetical protein [Natronorubrum tibetense]|uniref:Uncharacterized protein n=1 Tax=Natronorubrum tibetense GA33 TaxID=1114856 RepID=L9VEF8_9EURY|nr:hypothetical protein [Natronorubrum tibetense]ELY35575.1 hypothetical protein C496_23401 [Natronorubrum tibetense GA33]